MNKLMVMGVGPGSPDYVLPIVYRKVEQCDILIGGKRNLELFQKYNKEEITITANIKALIVEIKKLRIDNKIGILVSGDPGLYSFLATLLRYFEREEIEVIPGIGSLQYLFSKGVIPWNDAFITSLHGKRIDDFEQIIRDNKKVAFLTDTKYPAGEITRYLVNSGVENKRVLIGENLSYEDEKIHDLTLEESVGIEVANLCVMIIYDK